MICALLHDTKGVLTEAEKSFLFVQKRWVHFSADVGFVHPEERPSGRRLSALKRAPNIFEEIRLSVQDLGIARRSLRED